MIVRGKYPDYLMHYGVSINDGAPGVGTGNWRRGGSGIRLKESFVERKGREHDESRARSIAKSLSSKGKISGLALDAVSSFAKKAKLYEGFKTRHDAIQAKNALHRGYKNSIDSKNRSLRDLRNNGINPTHNDIHNYAKENLKKHFREYADENAEAKNILGHLEKTVVDFDEKLDKVTNAIMDSIKDQYAGEGSPFGNLSETQAFEKIKDSLEDASSDLYYRYYQ